jgi:Undecaprenyl-phosphate glucose phosphotransferase
MRDIKRVGRFFRLGAFERSKVTVQNAGRVEATADEFQNGTQGRSPAGEGVRRRKNAGLSPAIVSGIVGVADVAIILGVGVGFYFGYVDRMPGDLPRYIALLLSNAVLTAGLFYFFGLYNFGAILAPGRRLGKIVSICVFVFMVMVVWAFALKVSAEFSRVWFFVCLIGETTLICFFRLGTRTYIRSKAKAGGLTRRIAIVGDTMQAAQFMRTLQSTDSPWNEVVGVFDDRLDKERAKDRFTGEQVLGNIEDLLNYARQERIDDVVVALPWNAVDRLMSVIEQLRELPVNVRLAVDMIHYEFPDRESSNLAGIPVLDVAPKPLADWDVVVKAIEDKALAALALIVFGPLMALIALAIKLTSPGPILFRQKRYGFNNQLIKIYKFRTMFHTMCDDDAATLTSRDDPRVTPLGGFLRRTSLDELPQLFNVLEGTMSLVGPRPHAKFAKAGTKFYPEVVDQYAARHKVKPGITGWAQVNGWRGQTDTEEKIVRRVQHDVSYIENWSLWLDLKILVMTVFVGFGGRNVY